MGSARKPAWSLSFWPDGSRTSCPTARACSGFSGSAFWVRDYDFGLNVQLSMGFDFAREMEESWFPFILARDEEKMGGEPGEKKRLIVSVVLRVFGGIQNNLAYFALIDREKLGERDFYHPNL